MTDDMPPDDVDDDRAALLRAWAAVNALGALYEKERRHNTFVWWLMVAVVLVNLGVAAWVLLGPGR
jgi:hypothetical protein